MPGIFYADYSLPDMVDIEKCISRVPNNWLDRYKSKKDFIQDLRSDRFGFDKVAIGDRKKNLKVMSDLMAKFLADTKIDPEKISYLIDTDYFNFYLNERVNVTHYLQKNFGLKRACVFSLTQECGASCLAIGLASALASQKGGYVVVLSSTYWGTGDRLGFGQMIGDGAGILVISAEPTDYEIIDFASISTGFGSYTNYNKEKGNYDSDVVNYTANMHRRGVSFIENTLSKNKLVPGDIYMVITQPTNRVTYYEAYAKPLGISKDKFFLLNTANGGHLGNVDIARNFKDFTQMYSPPEGAYILFYAGAFNPPGDVTNNLVLVRRNNSNNK